MADFEHRLACVTKADGSIVCSYVIDGCELTDEPEYVTS
jgi:hypothetical protein